MTILAAINRDLVDRVGDLIDRTSSVETKVNVGFAFILFILASIGAAIKWIGLPQFQAWLDRTKKNIHISIEKDVREQIGTLKAATDVSVKKIAADAESKVNASIEERKKALETDDAKLKAYLTLAQEGASTVMQYSVNAKLATLPLIAWESGEEDVVYNNEGYKNGWVNFKNPFPITPQVFVGEGLLGQWLIVKVDEKYKDRFKWAATIVGGPVPEYKAKIQWFAVSKAIPVDKANMPPMNLASPSPEAAKVEATTASPTAVQPSPTSSEAAGQSK